MQRNRNDGTSLAKREKKKTRPLTKGVNYKYLDEYERKTSRMKNRQRIYLTTRTSLSGAGETLSEKAPRSLFSAVIAS